MKDNIMLLSNNLRQGIHSADKYARGKEYLCLLPGCKKKAIDSHAISRSLLLEAIAEDRHVYTQPPTFMSIIRMTSPAEPMEIERIGINKASVFKGFCSEHDRILFSPIEIRTKKWNSTGISLHLRSIAFEYCRKRLGRDFYTKLASLTDDPRAKTMTIDIAASHEHFMSLFEETYLKSIMALISGSRVDTVDHFSIPFSRNLQVSCCGMFQSKEEDPSSSICYNLISYKKVSMLTLTVFKYKENHLENFLSAYDLSLENRGVDINHVEKLVNDVAFFHCEEPLISPRLWDSLSDDEKFAVRCSMRPPGYRIETTAPRIIKIGFNDLITRRRPS